MSRPRPLGPHSGDSGGPNTRHELAEGVVTGVQVDGLRNTREPEGADPLVESGVDAGDLEGGEMPADTPHAPT